MARLCFNKMMCYKIIYYNSLILQHDVFEINNETYMSGQFGRVLTPPAKDITPGNSHRNGTVKRNANIYCKQMTLKATDNYGTIYLLCFTPLLYVFYSISAIMDDKKSLI